jgi:uncharacterized protein with ParB-like and HNH nuclease domain
MKINIENTPRSITDLFFNDGGTPGVGMFNCIPGNERVSKLIIPIYQREYDWGKEELIRLLINTKEYIDDLDPGQINNSYFVGTILLEKAENKSNTFEIIDGQQRITSAFLMNFVGYLIAKERCLKIPTFPTRKYAVELNNRLNKVKLFEDRLFIIKEEQPPEDWDLIFSSKFLEIDDLDESAETISIKKRLDINNILLWKTPKMHHENPEQAELFKNNIINTIIENEDPTLVSIPNNEFNERANNIFNYFKDLLKGPTKGRDEILGDMLNKIDLFSSAISFCVLISDNPDDSFKLFEVLNSTGRSLTIIDKIKKMLYENIVIKDKELTNEEFNARWKDLLELTENTGNSMTIDLARSESSLLKDKLYDYFSNKVIILNNRTIVRDPIFSQENTLVFFNRIITVSKVLNDIYKIDCYDSKNTPHTLGWYYRVINKMNYDWGRQVFLGTILLTNYFEEKFPIENDLWERPLIDNSSTLLQINSINRFLINLSDVLLKIGTIGIINGLSSNLLPRTSQDILNKIIDFVRANKSVEELNSLFNDIKGILSLYIDSNKVDFKTNLRYLTYSKSSDRKNMTLLLYILYNKGKSAINIIEKPSLEHFEPKTTPSVPPPIQYYSGADREEIINSLGNMILMEKNHNSRLGNIPIKSKIEKISTDPAFRNENFYGNNIYRNLDPDVDIKGDIEPYKAFPVIDITSGYDSNLAPTRELFTLRTDFYISNISDMICSINNYVLSGDEYVT